MIIGPWAVILLVILIVLGNVPTWMALWKILPGLGRFAQWADEAKLPTIEGFDDFEMKHLLAAAAELEFTTTGKRKPFSRKNMAMWVGRDRFETLRDGLAALGYLKIAEKRGTNRWTATGRDLLMQVKAGRFGTIVSVLHDHSLVRREDLDGTEIRMWTVEVK